MTAKIRQILIGTSLAATASMIGTVPAFAAGLTRVSDIQFTKNGVVNTDANQLNIRSWNYDSTKPPVYDSTGINGVNRQVLNDSTTNNTVKAITALTDGNSATNVELFTSGENVTDNIGFTGKLGKNTIKVESVTKADWADGKLATAWLTGFSNTYASLMQATTVKLSGINMKVSDIFQAKKDDLTTYLKTNGINGAGDANIGNITYDSASGKLNVDLAGHLDVRYGTAVSTSSDVGMNFVSSQSLTDPNLLFNTIFSALSAQATKSGTALQVSEIAKVTFNDKVDYAFGFAATDSGAIAGDRNNATDKTSHTGTYRWTQTFASFSDVPPSEKVPEPSALLALMAVGGVAFAQRKVKKQTLI
jgi:hypothetical protein